MKQPTATDVKVFVPSKDLETSLSFYKALGWQENWRQDGLAEIELANVRLYLQGYYEKKWAENCMIYVAVDDAQAWHDHVNEVLSRGGFSTARTQPPKKEPYGAIVTYVWDPCGVLLHFAQAINDG